MDEESTRIFAPANGFRRTLSNTVPTAVAVGC
jgi:hypothetical protein